MSGNACWLHKEDRIQPIVLRVSPFHILASLTDSCDVQDISNTMAFYHTFLQLCVTVEMWVGNVHVSGYNAYFVPLFNLKLSIMLSLGLCLI